MDRVEKDLAALVGFVAGLGHVSMDSEPQIEERFAQNEVLFAKLAELQTKRDEAFGNLLKTWEEWRIRNRRQ